MSDDIEIRGAQENNLKNIDLNIPGNKIVVLTGVSGCGKSSLAFGTLFTEGHRRYIETFSAYARQFLSTPEKPKVDSIEGLPPVIAIEQKTTSYNPRSTVGIVTEIYDFLRLLYAKLGVAKSYISGKDMVSYTTKEVIETLQKSFYGKKIMVMAPVVVSRKGNYQHLLKKFLDLGFVSANINGTIMDLDRNISLPRYQNHDISIVIDKIIIGKTSEQRVRKSLETAMNYGNDTLKIYDLVSKETTYYSRLLMCPDSGMSYPKPEPNLFSFNSMVGRCKTCKGLGTVLTPDIHLIVTDPKKSLRERGIAGLISSNRLYHRIKLILDLYNIEDSLPLKDYDPKVLNEILTGNKITKFQGIIPLIDSFNTHPENYSEVQRKWAQGFLSQKICHECEGDRIHRVARHFFIQGQSIAQITRLSISELSQWILELEDICSPKQRKICQSILSEIKTRIQFILDVGLNYLSLNRAANELSGGEAQRIRLATQIGSQLMGILYILDEPSIGLHQRDNEKLIQSLKNLRDMGNSVLVVEHDKDIMLEADEVIEIGPGAGAKGGEIIVQGKASDLLETPSPTFDYLSGRQKIHTPSKRSTQKKHFIKITGTTGNNLKNIDLNIPLGVLTCITGVSGSGKSTLINKTLYPILNRHCYGSRVSMKPLAYESFSGLEHIDKVINIDQKPIGRTPRSNPATYTKMFDEIRALFAKVQQAKIRGYKAGYFSFNIKGGRCEGCKGYGKKSIKMDMLPDVHVLCDECFGKRFHQDVLRVTYKNMNISEILSLSVNEAAKVFDKIPTIYHKLRALKDTGLGYITLGQSSTTISGGEAQRIKLARELAKIQTQKTLYILDEPTTGLHFRDIDLLMQTLQKLVDQGNTVIIIEHNIDVIKTADHIIDIGPEGGNLGGQLIFEGTPEQLALTKKGYTAQFL